MSSEVNRESVQKESLSFWMGCDVISESAKSSSLGHCCFSSGKEKLSTKNRQTEVGEVMQSSRKQKKKNMKRWDVPEVSSVVTNLNAMAINGNKCE